MARAVFSNFIQLQFHWTLATEASDTTEAWMESSVDFGIYTVPIANTGYTLAVR